MAFLLAGLTAVLYGVFDFAGGLATRRANVLVVAVWANIVGLGIALLLAMIHHQVVGASVTLPDLAWGAVSGLAGVTGAIFYFLGLAKGQMAVVAPVSAVTLALVPFLFGVATGDRHPVLAWMGVMAAIPALWLTVHTRSHQTRPGKALYGLAAGLAFSLFFIGIARISPEAGLWPLITVKLGSLTSVGSLLILRRVPIRLPRQARLAFLAGGTILANLTYLLAVQIGPFGLVAVVSSFYPIVIAIMARIVEKEEISPYRMAGLTLSVLSLALITL